MARVEQIGLATLHLAEWQDVHDLPRPAAIISDPPYGQAVNTNVSKKADPDGARYKANGARNLASGGKNYPEIRGDGRPFNPSPLLSMADIVVLWGAHKFADKLPEGSWLCWDKVPNGKVKSQGDGEAAWISQRRRPLRMFRHLWDGLSIAGGYETRVERVGAAAVKRVHPTQKPVDLMTWTIAQARVPAGGLILDPYMGAGSTGIAAVLAGYPFIGVECEPLYFDAACRRIDRAQQQLKLFGDAA